MHEVKHVNFREKSHVDPANNYQEGSSHALFAAGWFFRWKRTSGRAIFPRAIARTGNSRIQIRKTNANIGGYTSRFIASEKEQRAQEATQHAGCHGSIFALHAFIWSIIPNSARYRVGRCCSWSCGHEIAIAALYPPSPAHLPERAGAKMPHRHIFQPQYKYVVKKESLPQKRWKIPWNVDGG